METYADTLPILATALSEVPAPSNRLGVRRLRGLTRTRRSGRPRTSPEGYTFQPATDHTAAGWVRPHGGVIDGRHH
jgi:hypothetical protein